MIENPEVFLQNLIKSLKSIKSKPYSSYKVDLSLSYLKKVYEAAFPSIGHGGSRTFRADKTKDDVQNLSPNHVVLSTTWVKNVSLADRNILINLFQGINDRKNIPSFNRLIGLHTGLSQ
ncbi:unnamed protein product, partial [marine sediment metagenome]